MTNQPAQHSIWYIEVVQQMLLDLNGFELNGFDLIKVGCERERERQRQGQAQRLGNSPV